MCPYYWRLSDVPQNYAYIICNIYHYIECCRLQKVGFDVTT